MLHTMLYMIQIWCPPPSPPTQCAWAWIWCWFTPHQAGQAPHHPWSILLVSGSTLVMIGDKRPTAGNTTPPGQCLSPVPQHHLPASLIQVFVFWLILSWSLWYINQLPISMWSNCTNKYVILRQLIYLKHLICCLLVFLTKTKETISFIK